MEQYLPSYPITKRIAALVFLLFSGHLAVFGSIVSIDQGVSQEDAIELLEGGTSPDSLQLPTLVDELSERSVRLIFHPIPNSFAATLDQLEQAITTRIKIQANQFQYHQILRLKLLLLDSERSRDLLEDML